ncbi:MAG: HAMP domain-containing protein, partial [Syntrophomonadaceae bacterium]|nr:HAMP domain-containing protein [Syntrophomonadaceae bacterium]
MFRSFRGKLTGSYLLLIIVLLIIAGGLVFSSFKSYYMQNLESRLTREAYLIADMAKYIGDTPDDYNNLCLTASLDSDTRVSIIDKNGLVLGDSQFEISRMDIHKSRPEVYTALQGKAGVAIRYSTTEKINMLYVAVPFENQTQNGVIRMAIPLAELAAINNRIFTIMLFALFISAMLATLLSLLMAKRFSAPLHEITVMIQDMTADNLDQRILYQADDELGILVSAFNNMAEHIERGISEINEVKNRLEALLDNTVNGILMVDVDAVIRYVNPVALALLNIKDNIIGRSSVEVINNFEIIETIDQVKNELQPLRKEIILHNLDEKIVEVNIVPVMNANHFIQGILVVLNDISELKRLEQVRKDFVSNVSHELKTPLA